jgi:membrane-associated PAP2 superfamily phosphatase
MAGAPLKNLLYSQQGQKYFVPKDMELDTIIHYFIQAFLIIIYTSNFKTGAILPYRRENAITCKSTEATINS